MLKPSYLLGKNQESLLSLLTPEELSKGIQLQSDFILYSGAIFKLLTNETFQIPHPIGRTSHIIQIANAFEEVHAMKCKKLMIRLPPRTGKSFLAGAFASYGMSLNPLSNFVYTSYGYDLVTKLTSMVRDIMSLPDYSHFFGVRLSNDTQRRDWFKTEDGGAIIGAGAGGPITGVGAGMSTREDIYSGSFMIDDPHNPEHPFITKKESDDAMDWYTWKVVPRLNNPNVSIVIIGHRLGENDLQGRIMEIEKDEWKVIEIEAIYEHEGELHSFYPQRFPLDSLLELRHKFPEMFSTMYQQKPIVSGNQLFKGEYFDIQSEEPEILFSFITADTAETAKTHNDATVFSFFGVYRVKNTPDTYAIHWIDCDQMWIEPKDLRSAFMNFYDSCCRYKVKPSFAVIEEKSTGVTLVSELKSYQGLEIIAIKPTQDKISRFKSMQPYIARRLVSFTKHAKHLNMCIEHMEKITPTGAYRFDDIADTLYNGIKIGLMDVIYRQRFMKTGEKDSVINQAIDKINQQASAITIAKQSRYGNGYSHVFNHGDRRFS